jgi:hypothetical protein
MNVFLRSMGRCQLEGLVAGDGNNTLRSMQEYIQPQTLKRSQTYPKKKKVNQT